MLWRLIIVVVTLVALVAIVFAEKDYYAVLGLPKDTSERAIKKAYRKLSMKYHPDKNQGNQEAHDKFLEITEAYQVLSDPEKRRRYDMYGEDGIKDSAQGGGGFRDPFDMFSSFFGGDGFFGGGGNRRSQERRSPTVHTRLEVTLEDMYNGADVDVDISRWHICPKCRGSGAKDSSDIEVCKVCGGTGVKIIRHQLAPGMFQQVQTHCEACGGKGKTIRHHCPYCGGEKVVRGNMQITVVVEKGMQDGETIPFSAIGDESPEAGAGDVVFLLKQQTHPTFHREGHDLHMSLDISLLEALTGFERKITHLDGRKVTVKREDVTPHGFQQAVENEGMPHHMYPSDRGSLFISYRVNFPPKLSEQQKKIISDLFSSEESPATPSPPASSHEEL